MSRLAFTELIRATFGIEIEMEAKPVNGRLERVPAHLTDDMVATFLADTPKQLVELRLALQQSDVIAIRQISHYLKGCASFLDAGFMADLCDTLELFEGCGDLRYAEEIVSNLEAEFARIYARLEAQLRDHRLEAA